ncbi:MULTISPECIES: bifunctional diguanylate cyclase/phosphodiesterase [unclassified Massilia]|uniref:putative bifunctional diguanylate cyclase/phosphodiesterase n=1 Tax=unclassified Massilia TaxID=2609279 RepID=UPI0017849B36|nr:MULTISPECIES: sensor domain-containing phosphodiesterase [unclassified Massilia]MBD8528842.1 sensor domain-containing phosphodiesterase [Massilia sp. CFBP 13647]MBD8673484.1 sensor domain-containing phosphodiesterase [Massilia sp. CFBP 13721]
MMTPATPVDEARRLAALHATNLFGTGPEEAFDRITRMAAKLLNVPTALISLVGTDTQWFKSRCGMEAQSGPRDTSFCGHAILGDEPMVIEDAMRDPRFADNPSVVGEPHVRFYAGVQLYSVERAKLGTLCIIDSAPRALDAAALDELHDLARMVEELIYHRQLAIASQRLHDGVQQNASGAQLAAAADQVEFLLTHDTLTGLANRQALLGAIHDSVAGWRRRGAPAAVAAVACLNLDRFKRINDAFGHAAGDEVLVAVTRCLQAELDPQDLLARIGSDEFVLLLNHPGDGNAVHARLRRLMDSVNGSVSWAGKDIAITCSLGFACFPADGEDADTLLSNAATAMRHAKETGGARLQQFAPAQRREMGRRLALEHQLHRALEREELFLQYQPKIDLHKGSLVGFEALLRWRHPQHGVVSPEEFVPIAEETGLIVPIGDWIVRTAVHQMAAWHGAGLPAIPVAVNLSARQFLQGDVVALVEELLIDAGIAPHLLELELTESLSMADPERSLAIMHRLRALGVTLSIDDFGTGYSSFSYLKRLPIDKLKIDKSFVHDMVHSADARAIVQAIVAMAHRMGLRVVAEGVESAEQAMALRETGCDQGQGYFYARPLDAFEAGTFPAPGAASS